MVDTGMVCPPTVQRVSEDRSADASAGWASMVAYMAGTPSNIVARCCCISRSASAGSKRSMSTTVPPTRNVPLITTLPYTCGAGSAVTTTSLLVRACIVAVRAQLSSTARWLCTAPFGCPVVPEV